MGDVISISRVSDVDIFSQFDGQCPEIPAEIDARIPRSARKALEKSVYHEVENNFRNHCVLVVVASLLVLAGVKLTTNAITARVGLHQPQAELLSTDYRNSQSEWAAQIQRLESDPAYQRVLEEKRLFALEYAGQ